MPVSMIDLPVLDMYDSIDSPSPFLAPSILSLGIATLFSFRCSFYIIYYYICWFDDATNMRYRGVLETGKGMRRFVIATLCLFPALDDSTGRTDVSRPPCVMISFLVPVIHGRLDGEWLLSLTLKLFLCFTYTYFFWCSYLAL
jgi:hypothetical protein